MEVLTAVVLAHLRSDYRRHDRFHHLNVDPQCGRAIYCPLPTDKLLCRLHRLLLLDLLIFSRPPAKRAAAIAIISAFSQLGNIAGSYVWQLEAYGFRKSYGIVLSMFGTTVIGSWVFRMILVNLNKKLEASESALEMRLSNGTDRVEVEALDDAVEAPTMKGNFRYLI